MRRSTIRVACRWQKAIAMLACGCLAGCEEAPKLICESSTILQAKRIVVLPFAGAPGLAGRDAGHMETGAVLTTFGQRENPQVEGPGRLRKAMREKLAGSANLTPQLQAQLAREMGVDLLMLGEVAEYRSSKKTHTLPLPFVAASWSETTCHVTVNVRLIAPDSGRLVYSSSGKADSTNGYGEAVLAATQRACEPLTNVLATASRGEGNGK